MAKFERRLKKIAQVRLTLAERKINKKPLMNSLNTKKFPVTAMHRFRAELRSHRERPFAEVPPALIRQERKPAQIPLVNMVSPEFSANRERLQMIDVAMSKKKNKEEFKKNFENTLPAVRGKTYKTQAKHAALEAVVDEARVAKLMDVAQFYRGSKRIIVEQTHAINKKKPESWKYGEQLYHALDGFAEDWVEAGLVDERKKLLIDAWK